MPPMPPSCAPPKRSFGHSVRNSDDPQLTRGPQGHHWVGPSRLMLFPPIPCYLLKNHEPPAGRSRLISASLHPEPHAGACCAGLLLRATQTQAIDSTLILKRSIARLYRPLHASYQNRRLQSATQSVISLY